MINEQIIFKRSKQEVGKTIKRDEMVNWRGFENKNEFRDKGRLETNASSLEFDTKFILFFKIESTKKNKSQNIQNKWLNRNCKPC